MNISKLTALTAMGAPFFLATAAWGQGQSVTNTISTTVNAVIPDGNLVGINSSLSLSGTYGAITSINVSLDISGGFNGDFYVYLVGPTGDFSVLLNRVGLTGSNPFGYSDTGLNITFADGAPNIHTYQLDGPSYNGGGQLTGTWAPDGRNIDPQSSGSVFDSTSPTANLSSFIGDGADGTWTLYVADVSGGSQGSLVSWGLTVVTVPEPQTWGMLAGGIGLLVTLSRRRKL